MRIKTIILLLPLLLSFQIVYAETYLSDDFDDYSSISNVSSGGWTYYNTVTLETSGCVSGKCIKLRYGLNGGVPYPQFNHGATTFGGEFYIKFWSKLTNKQDEAWPKYLKFFGALGATSNNYSNFTFGSGSYYDTPNLNGFSHGGLNIPGDTQCWVRWTDGRTVCLNGSPGTVQETGPNFTWPDENWHEIIIHFKYNTDGNSDGQWETWIDRTKVFNVTGVQNRNDASPRYFNYFSFGSHNPNAMNDYYYIWFDSVVVASTYVEVIGDDTTPIVSISAPDSQASE